MGDGYSLAWRVLDAAQGWGVAQRRKRVFAVLDLAGQRAGQVLFESEGVSGYTPPRGEARQGAAAGAAGGVGAAGCAGRSTGGFCTGQSSASRSDGYGEERAPTLRGGKPPGVAIGFNPTHSHTPDSPRYRIITPLQRDVSPEEYFAITRYLAAAAKDAASGPELSALRNPFCRQ